MNLILTGRLQLIRKGDTIVPLMLINKESVTSRLLEESGAFYDIDGVADLGEAIIIIETIDGKIRSMIKGSHYD